MRRVLRWAVFPALLALLWGCAAPPGGGNGELPEGLHPVRVVEVTDGDTVVVRMPGSEDERLRLIGVDAPETADPPDPYGPEAAAYARERLEGRKVYLETDVEERDRHGRLLGYVWLEPPDAVPAGTGEVREKMFNARMLLDGYAMKMTVAPNVRYADCFQEFQREAREQARGLWGLPADEEEYYLGNRNTRRFHRPDCPDAARIAPENVVRLADRAACFDAGFEPCRNCKP